MEGAVCKGGAKIICDKIVFNCIASFIDYDFVFELLSMQSSHRLYITHAP